MSAKFYVAKLASHLRGGGWRVFDQDGKDLSGRGLASMHEAAGLARQMNIDAGYKVPNRKLRRSAKKNPRKGAMPAALKKYWASRRRGKSKPRVRSKSLAELSAMTSEERDAHYKRYYNFTKSSARRKRAKRRANPAPRFAWRLIALKGAEKLYLSAAGDKFVKSGAAKYFQTIDAVRAAARDLSQRYGRALGRYALLADPTRR